MRSGGMKCTLPPVRFIARRTAETNQKLSLDSGKLTGAAMAGLAAIESIKAAGNETGDVDIDGIRGSHPADAGHD